jgi:hypothetical protein
MVDFAVFSAIEVRGLPRSLFHLSQQFARGIGALIRQRRQPTGGEGGDGPQ